MMCSFKNINSQKKIETTDIHEFKIRNPTLIFIDIL